MTYIEQMRIRFEAIWPYLNEKSRKLWAAAEAQAFGRGGLQMAHEVTGMSRVTISDGIRELANKSLKTEERIRKVGAGRKLLTDVNPKLLTDLKDIVESSTMGNPESPLLWTTQSLRTLATILQTKGHNIGHVTVGNLLSAQGYSLQGNRKTLNGNSHPDRDAQFRFIADRVAGCLADEQPVISVDTKKKELIGLYKNGGRSYRPKGNPIEVKDHDFEDKELGKIAPYGVYDLKHNEAWVNVGIDHDTATFAVESIRRWWNMMGKERYPDAQRLMITADGGGSNGSRIRLWKAELQKFANETELEINVCHFPPGTSKWNKIEHRLFSAISLNWRGRPLINHQIVINLIESTTTRTGLKVRAELDINCYPKGMKVSDTDMEALNHTPDPFHGEWNYKIICRTVIN